MSELPENEIAAALAQLELGPAVPPPLQQAVAAALTWVDRLGRDAAGPGAFGSPPRDRVRRLR